MSPQVYTVRCKPSSAATLKTTLWKGSVQITDEIVVTTKTDFELTADYANSDATVMGFHLNIAPAPMTDITAISGQGSPVVRFTDLCTQRANINLNLVVSGSGGNHPMGPRPIIRNDPRRQVSRVMMVITVVLLAVLAALLLVWYYTH